jgi:chitin disaccharide deacetylase
VAGNRFLIVTADDFGIGPETSRGILDLAAAGRVTNTVLLVNSPFSIAAVHAWRKAGRMLELGWHPCLTLDRPILPINQVPSLVAADGRFHRLGVLACRLVLRQIRQDELTAELAAQYRRFVDLVGHAPSVINTHHHVQVFPMIGAALRKVLREAGGVPYLRRIQESWRTLAHVPGARPKRLFLTALGMVEGRRQARTGLPGNEWLAGITDPSHVHNPQFYAQWLTSIPGRVVELTCHPGYKDESLVDRDCAADDGQQERRVRELELLRQPAFHDVCRQAGFQLVSPTELAALLTQSARRAA